MSTPLDFQSRICLVNTNSLLNPSEHAPTSYNFNSIKLNFPLFPPTNFNNLKLKFHIFSHLYLLKPITLSSSIPPSASTTSTLPSHYRQHNIHSFPPLLSTLLSQCTLNVKTLLAHSTCSTKSPYKTKFLELRNCHTLNI